MPVETGHLYGRVVARRKSSSQRENNQNSHEAYADDHVQRVHSGHCEIEGKEQLGVPRIWTAECKSNTRHQVFFELLEVFEELDAQKHRPQQHCEQQEPNELTAIPLLRGMDRQSHSQAAGEQDRGIGPAKNHIQPAACVGECGRVCRPVYGISGKQSSKEHDLCGQEYPHPEGRCFLLLFGIIKLRGQCCTSFRQLEPPPRRENRTRMPPPSRQELPRNCPSEAARASATPDPWLARDSDPPPVRSGATTAGTPWE